MATNMYLFAGWKIRTKEIVGDVAALRLNKQTMDEESQPSELRRTQAFSYFNLTHIVNMCYLPRYLYPNYYQEQIENKKAFEFLGQYV